jgi:protein arginine N-methyltransferase 5
MNASRRSGRRIRVYAVEKNPNAVVHIQAMIKNEGWESQVWIVCFTVFSIIIVLQIEQS